MPWVLREPLLHSLDLVHQPVQHSVPTQHLDLLQAILEQQPLLASEQILEPLQDYLELLPSQQLEDYLELNR